MAGTARRAVVARLRAAIGDIEKGRPPLADGGPGSAREGAGAEAPFARLEPGALHEIFAPSYGDGGAGLGFALAQGARLVSPRRPALVWLGLKAESGETGLLYAPGLARLGMGSGALVMVLAEGIVPMLWAAEEATASPAVAAVVLECLVPHRALDFTALRRLSLRAGQSSTPVLVLRYGEGREASPARTRWAVRAAPSAQNPFDGRAPGEALWRASLEKAPQGKRGEWLLGLSQGGEFHEHKEAGHGFRKDGFAGRPGGYKPAAVPGAPFPALGDRGRKAG